MSGALSGDWGQHAPAGVAGREEMCHSDTSTTPARLNPYLTRENNMKERFMLGNLLDLTGTDNLDDSEFGQLMLGFLGVKVTCTCGSDNIKFNFDVDPESPKFAICQVCESGDLTYDLGKLAPK